MDNQTVQKEMLIAFEYCYLHDDWVNPLKDALDGLNAGQAARKLSAESKSIWEIVLHTAVWNEDIVTRVRSKERSRPAEGAWPAIQGAGMEQDWDRDKKRLWDSLESVRAMIESGSLDEIQAGPYGIADLLCRYIHNGYHIGQITKMREFMDSDKPEDLP